MKDTNLKKIIGLIAGFIIAVGGVFMVASPAHAIVQPFKHAAPDNGLNYTISVRCLDDPPQVVHGVPSGSQIICFEGIRDFLVKKGTQIKCTNSAGTVYRYKATESASRWITVNGVFGPQFSQGGCVTQDL